MALVKSLGTRIRALGTSDQPLDKCENEHTIQDVAIRCPEQGCQRFILFLPSVFVDRKARSLTYGALIVLATVVAFVLFRFTSQIWPLYLFLMVGIVHLYATIFSRGSVLGSAMWFLVAIAAASVVWAIVSDGFHLTAYLGGATQMVLRLAPVVVWLLITVYMFVLGSGRTLTAIQTASTYFLATATFTLGFWGVWVIYVENGLVNQVIYQIAIGLGLLLPLLCILFLFALPTRGNRDMREWLMSLSALGLVVFAAYLIVIEPLVTALGFLLGRLFPRILGMAPLDDVTTAWLGGSEWRALVTSVLLLVAAALVVVQGALEEANVENQRRAQLSEDTDQIRLMLFPATAGPQNPPADPRGALAHAADELQGVTEDAVVQASFVARFLGGTGWAIAKNIGNTIRRAINVVLPVVAFSMLSVLVVLVLGKFSEYLTHGPFVSTLSLWAMSLTILIVVVVLCGLAFDFAPSRPSDRGPAWKRRRILGVPLVVMMAASLLGSLCYFLVSMASTALLPMLWPTLGSGPSSLAALLSGDIYLTNLAVSLVAMALLAGLYAVGNVKKLRHRPKFRETYLGISAAAILVLLAIASLYYAVDPVRTTFAFATEPYNSSAEQTLRTHVVSSLEPSCAHDHLVVTGAVGSVSCRDAAGATVVSYHLFRTSPHLIRWYDETVRARGIRLGAGTCVGQTSPAENLYVANQHSGRLACKVDRRGAWLIWTDTASLVLVVAIRADGRADALFASWSAGNIGLQSV